MESSANTAYPFVNCIEGNINYLRFVKDLTKKDNKGTTDKL